MFTQAKSPGPIRELQAWIHENLSKDLSIEKLADKVAMSVRNFTRIFTRETGVTPAKYVEEVRLEYARQQLEQSSDKLERVARERGFGNSLTLRRVFEKNLQISPSEYRSRFCSMQMA